MDARHSAICRTVLLVLACASGQIQADLIFSAPPRENADQGRKLYEPFANFLSETIGERVVYEQARNWVQYSLDMRSGRYDIVFDGPHFTAWRMKHLKHIPVARLPGVTEFMLVAWQSDRRIRTVKDLVSKSICTLTSPNLGTAAMLSQFKNPVLQPEIYEVSGGFDDVYQTFTTKNCRAAVIRDFVYKKLSAEAKQDLNVLFKTASMPNQTISISERISKPVRDRLISLLTAKQGPQAAEPLFSEFSKKSPYFIRVSSADYKGLENYLEGVVWGW